MKKKTTSKSTPASPVSSASVAPLTRRTPAAVPAAIPAARPAAAAFSPLARAAASSVAPAVAKPAPAAAPETVVAVKVDVGFGNRVFVRGEGAGLSWEKGVPAACAASDLWTISLKDAAQPVRFKVLVNDEVWCAGSDYEVRPGQKVTLTPSF